MSESIQHNSESSNKTGEAEKRQITVDGGMMIVQEVRKASLKKGCNIIQAEGVPNGVDKETIMCRIRTKNPIVIKSKTFRPAEKMTPQRALDELKGHDVLVYYTTPFKLQTYDGKVVCGNSDELLLTRPISGDTMIAKRPEAIISKQKLRDLREVPALEFEIESDEDQEVDIDVLFHSKSSLSCSISHNLVLDDSGKECIIRVLESNALLSNNSGCDWSNVTIKIMTGEKKAREEARSFKAQPQAAMMAFDSMSYESAGGGAEAESVGERKLFELPPGISLKNGDSKLIQLNLATDVPAVREFYLVDAQYKDQPARSKLSFKNLACDKSCGMGKPIAAGKSRVYQYDKSGALQPTKEFDMPDAPVGDTVIRDLGETPDIKATRQVTKQEEVFVDKDGKPLGEKEAADLENALKAPNNRRWVMQRVLRTETFEVSIRNFKDKQVVVSVPQSLNPNQKILKSPFKLEDPTLAKALMTVPARTDKGAGEKKMVYVIQSLIDKNIQIGDDQLAAPKQ